MSGKQRPAAALGNEEIRFAPAGGAPNVVAMRSLRVMLLFILGLVAPLGRATESVATNWDQVMIAPMKTSIYLGSVSLATGVFVRQGSILSTTYEAKVFPWFFWGEKGQITITLTDADLGHLARGETAVFTGEAVNQKNQPRHVTGRAQPANAMSGKIKVRIEVGDVELIFNGRYKFAEKTSG